MKRSVDEPEEFARKLKTKAEPRVEESKNLGEGAGAGYLDVARETGARSLGESDAKFNQAALELTNSTWEEYEALRCDLGRIDGQGVG